MSSSGRRGGGGSERHGGRGTAPKTSQSTPESPKGALTTRKPKRSYRLKKKAQKELVRTRVSLVAMGAHPDAFGMRVVELSVVVADREETIVAVRLDPAPF